MTIKKSTQETIQKFAKEQTKQSVAPHDMTYFEILGDKVTQTMHRAKHQIGRLRVTSRAHREETEDLAGYMIDYVQELMDQGMSETDALDQVTIDFDVNNPENPLITNPHYEAWQTYYGATNPEIKSAVSMIYSSRILIGLAIGFILGLFGQIFYNSNLFGLVFALCVICGFLLGVGLAVSKHSQWIYESQDVE